MFVPYRRARALLLAAFLAHLSSLIQAVPPPIHYPTFLHSSARVATFDDINADFRFVYGVTPNCPQTISFGQPELDEREIALVPIASTTEDATACSGPSPITFVTEATVQQEGLLASIGLQAFQAALDANPNAKQLTSGTSNSALLVGWHGGDRTCASTVYPTNTFYFIINEEEGYRLRLEKSDQIDVLFIPESQRALLVVAPNSNICLFTDKSSKPSDDVTLTVTEIATGQSTTTLLLPGGSQRPLPTPSSNPAASPAAPPASSNRPTSSSSAAPSGASPSTAPVASPVATPSPATTVAAGPVPSTSFTASPSISSNTPAAVGSSPVPELSPGAASGPGSDSGSDSGSGSAITVDDDPSVSPEGDDSACFPASATVRMESGAVKTMAKLEIGDRVLTTSGFSDVILFTHRQRLSHNAFYRIHTANGSLTVSSGHYVYANGGKLLAAKILKRTDSLEMEGGLLTGITGIDRVSAFGLYNPQTTSGTIIVNGFAASTYTTAIEPKLAHFVLMAPVRWLHTFTNRFNWYLSEALTSGSPSFVWLLPNGPAMVSNL